MTIEYENEYIQLLKVKYYIKKKNNIDNKFIIPDFN